MNPAQKNRRFEISLEWPLIILVALIAWRYGGYTTAYVVAWTTVVILAVALGLLTYVASKQPHDSTLELGGLKIRSQITPLPKRSVLTLVTGAVAFLFLAWHGHPLALVGVAALALELLPRTAAAAVWDEYLTDVVRRAAVQAGFVGMAAGVAAAALGASGLEVAVVAVGGYLMTLQLYFARMRW